MMKNIKSKIISCTLLFCVLFNLAATASWAENGIPHETEEAANGGACGIETGAPSSEENAATPEGRGEVEYYCREALSLLDNAEGLLFAYDSIVRGIEACEETISVYDGTHALTPDEIKTVFDAYRRDHVEQFWLGNGYSMSYTAVSVISVSPRYTMTKEELAQAKVRFDMACNEVLSCLDGGESEFERELKLHDALAERVTYIDTANAHNAYGALVEGEAVCEGYAEALQHLLRKAGIQSFIALGASVNPSTGKGEAHAWNTVRIDGKYYQLDLTWDDQGERIFHAYFNQTDEALKEDHIIDEASFALPVCDSTEANYFEVMGGALLEYDEETVGEMLKNSSYVARVYIQGDVSEFISWYNNSENVRRIAKAAGIVGSFQYGYARLGREVELVLIPSMSISSMSMTVGELFGLNFYVRIEDEELLETGTLAMRFTVNGKSTVIRDYAERDGYLVFTLAGLEAHMMCDLIDLELIMYVSFFSTKVLATKTGLSIEKYCVGVLEEYSDVEALANLVRDILLYGAAAQRYEGYNLDDIAGDDIGLGENGLMPDEREEYAPTKTESDKYSVKTVGLSLDGGRRIFFEVLASDSDFVLNVDGREYRSDELVRGKNGTYYFFTEPLVALDTDRVFTFKLYGAGQIIFDAEYSLNTFAYEMARSDQAQTAIDLALAIYRFGRSADTYAFLNGIGV